MQSLTGMNFYYFDELSRNKQHQMKALISNFFLTLLFFFIYIQVEEEEPEGTSTRLKQGTVHVVSFKDAKWGGISVNFDFS